MKRGKLKLKPLAPELKAHQDAQAEYWAGRQAKPLTVRWHTPVVWYVAVHQHGYGCHVDVAKAILLAQESVKMAEKPSQLLIYRHTAEIEPTGFVTWPNGEEPKLVGCTNTHKGWKRRSK